MNDVGKLVYQNAYDDVDMNDTYRTYDDDYEKDSIYSSSKILLYDGIQVIDDPTFHEFKNQLWMVR